MFVDTHCHLPMMVKKEFDTKLQKNHFPLIQKILDDAKQNNVERIITIATSIPESHNAITIAKQFENVYATIGIHPCDCKELWRQDFEEITKLIKCKNTIVGIGETGLDFYHKPFFKQRQIDAFKFHIELALENNLPLIIHIRESVDEVLKILEQYKNQAHGVAHCFSQSLDIAKLFIDWNFFIGIGGPITYPKNFTLRNIVKNISLEKIVLETDAPFLPPQPYRGQQNHPKYIPLIAQEIANVKEVVLEVVEEVTTKNACKLFGI
jgi:TatD DNase family protein